MDRLCIVFTWTFLLVLSKPQHSIRDSCLHDVIHGTNENFVLKKTLSTREESGRKVKRHASQKSLHGTENALRIKPVYFLSQYLLEDEKSALHEVLERAISRIEELLSVVHRVEGPLLLKRKEACPVVLTKGINKGKCSRIKKGYIGENCLDNFRIPSEHLEGFAVYNKTYPDPIRVYKTDGPGLKDTDFVLYVTSQKTPLCNPYKTSALAYAAACQLNDKGRPVAGQVNFCPRTLKAQKFDGELLYKTAIHELFHALGFSSKLFEKFVTCDTDGGRCSPKETPLVHIVNGLQRLVTPAVVREMKQHFGCDAEDDFGGPLEVVDGKTSSHWNPILMHSSIMTAKEQKPYLTLIDPITLAVFEDSGWYKVNYSNADPFIWGKGKGCQFGLHKDCSEDGFCLNNSTGCHHLRLSKAKCNSNPNTRCGLFAADQKPCFKGTSQETSSDDETFSENSRCFMSSLVPLESLETSQAQISGVKEMTGRCYESKCESNNVYVRVQNGEWILCPPGSKAQVNSFDGFIHCPPVMEVCTSFLIKDVPIESQGVSVPPTDDDRYKRNTLQSDDPERDKTRVLYIGLRLPTDLNSKELTALYSACSRVLKENEILFFRSTSVSFDDVITECTKIGLKDDNPLDEDAIRVLYSKAITDTFVGKYDGDYTISVNPSRKNACNRQIYRSGRTSWYMKNYGNRVIVVSSSFISTMIGLLWFLLKDG